jgi:3-hydroxyacyl-CoA dehydrogenase
MHYEAGDPLAIVGVNARLRNSHVQDSYGVDDDRPVYKSVSLPTCKADLRADLSAHGSPRAVGRVGIIGVNAVSIGLTISLLDADLPVTLFELKRDLLDSGVELARSGYRDAVTKGELSPDQRDRRMALLAGTVNFHHLKDCDLIIDAMYTDRASKEKLFHCLDQVAKPGAVLMTDASNISVDHIARCTRRPGEVLGFHFANSSHAGETWKVVPGKNTSSDALCTVIALARRLHKVTEICDICHGVTVEVKSATSHLDGVAP